MITDGNDVAYPTHPESSLTHKGLTKREFFACQILIGLLSDSERMISSPVEEAVKLSDSLIRELNEPSTLPNTFPFPLRDKSPIHNLPTSNTPQSNP